MKVVRTEAGQGGRRGHSNMTHWSPTEHIKFEMKKKRRRANKAAIAEQKDN